MNGRGVLTDSRRYVEEMFAQSYEKELFWRS
jgi:hypothetical protein